MGPQLWLRWAISSRGSPGRAQRSCPMTRHAFAGFKKQDPDRSRLPLPMIIATALAHQLCVMDLWSGGLLVMMMVYIYLRTGEAAQLTVGQLIAPEPRAGQPQWKISLHPRERDQASKTGAFDDTLPLDLAHMQWMAEISRDLRLKRHHHRTYIDYHPERLRPQVPPRSARLAISSARLPVMYQLRHCGASSDVAGLMRTELRTKARGRWAADSTMKRYAKGGRLADQFHRLPPEIVDHTDRTAKSICQILGRPQLRFALPKHKG